MAWHFAILPAIAGGLGRRQFSETRSSRSCGELLRVYQLFSKSGPGLEDINGSVAEIDGLVSMETPNGGKLKIQAQQVHGRNRNIRRKAAPVA